MASDKIQVVVEEAGITYDLVNDNLTPEFQRYKYGTMCSIVARHHESLNTASKLISSCDGVKFPKLLQALMNEKEKLVIDIDESTNLRDEYLAAHPAIESILIKEHMSEIYGKDDRESYLNKNLEYLLRF